MTEQDLHSLAEKWFPSRSGNLHERELAALYAVLKRRHVARAPEPVADRTLGERTADAVAEFGGSWTFICAFAVFLIIWAVVNTMVLTSNPFDPYPFIFLNLLLSMLAAMQAPIIMMSQNRQARKDRQAAEHDYEVNLKAEIEIMGLHEKLDDLRAQQITRLLEFQQQQIDLLTSLERRQIEMREA